MWLPLKTDYLPPKQAARRATDRRHSLFLFIAKVQQHIAHKIQSKVLAAFAFTSPSKQLRIKEENSFKRKLDCELDWAFELCKNIQGKSKKAL
jgi:hypothetical protein